MKSPLNALALRAATVCRSAKWRLSTALSLSLLIAGATGCGQDHSNTQPAAVSEQATSAIQQLATHTLAPATVATEVRLDGVIEALNQATVSAQTAGRVLALPVDVGDRVKKGDLIVQLTNTEQKARAASAEAAVAEARAQLTRMEELLAKKMIAKADFDKAEAAYKSAEANLKEATEGLANTQIFAPYAGIVLARHIKVGETVNHGTPLLTGLSEEHLRVQVDVPAQQIAKVREFKEARIALADGTLLSSKELRIPPSADPANHSFKVLVTLPEGDHNLTPGTLIKVGFISGSREQLFVPAAAVAQRGEVTGVYVLSKNTLDLRFIRLGSVTEDGRYPVLAGINAGETIALDPIAAALAYKMSHQEPAGE